MSKLLQIVIFNAIEAVAFFAGVGVWFVLHDHCHPVAGAVVGTVIWAAITQVEHVTAYNTGANRPFFSLPQ